MLEALKQAWKAFEQQEVPVGAVLVHNKTIIAKGYNQTEMLRDATAHAEMLCITAGSEAKNNWRLSDTTLFCTLEPCSMCAGAILLSRIPKVLFAAPDIRHGAAGSWVDLFSKKHPTHQTVVEQGPFAKYSAHLLKEFFSKKRNKA